MRALPRSDGFHGNRGEVFDEPYFFLQEGLAVSYPCEHLVESRHGFHPGSDFGAGGEDVLAGFLIAELGFVGHERLQAGFELIADIDNKGGAYVEVERRVDDLERAMGNEMLGSLFLVRHHAGNRRCHLAEGGMRRTEGSLQVELSETSQKAGFI